MQNIQRNTTIDIEGSDNHARDVSRGNHSFFTHGNRSVDLPDPNSHDNHSEVYDGRRSDIPIYVDDSSDSSEIDLCDTDISDVEVVGLSHFPIANNSSASTNTAFRRSQDISPFEDIMIHFPWGAPSGLHRTENSSSAFGLSMFQHIQERIRTQAMLIERLRLFNVDTSPTIPPKTIINSMPIERVKDLAEASSLGSCPICLDPYKPRMTVRVLPGCGHRVHKPCMDKWITKSLKYTCPLDNSAIKISPEESCVIDRPTRRRSTRRITE